MVTSRSRSQVTKRSWLVRRDRDFRWFWTGHTISAVGTQATAVALPLMAALNLGAGVGGVSAVATATFLPNVVLPLLAGHWLQDRRRRRVMVTADVVRAVCLAAVALAALVGALSLPLLVAAAFTVGAASVVFDVASFAYVPSMVEDDDLPAANQAMQGSATTAQVAGPGLGGALLQMLGPPAAVVADAASYLASAAGVSAARRPEPPPPEPARPGRVLDGLREVLGAPVLRALTAHAAVYNAAWQVLTVNLVVYAVHERGVGAGLYGLALSAAGIGALLGTLIALRLSTRLGYGRAFAAALLLSTGTPLLLAALPLTGNAFAAALAAVQVLSGIGLGCTNVLSVTLRQIVAPRESLARTNGGYRLLIFGVIPLGSAAGGLLGAALDSRAGVAIGATGLALSALPMLTARMRRLRRPQDAKATAPPGCSTARRV